MLARYNAFVMSSIIELILIEGCGLRDWPQTGSSLKRLQDREADGSKVQGYAFWLLLMAKS